MAVYPFWQPLTTYPVGSIVQDYKGNIYKARQESHGRFPGDGRHEDSWINLILHPELLPDIQEALSQEELATVVVQSMATKLPDSIMQTLTDLTSLLQMDPENLNNRQILDILIRMVGGMAELLQALGAIVRSQGIAITPGQPVRATLTFQSGAIQ